MLTISPQAPLEENLLNSLEGLDVQALELRQAVMDQSPAWIPGYLRGRNLL